MISIDIQKKLFGAEGEMQLKINTSFYYGDFIAIAGESGSGKTTFLRVLAGLEDAQGSIKIDDEIWLDGKKSLPVQKRKIGFVFQDLALFSNMSVEQNLLYVNNDKKLSRRLLEMTHIYNLKDRYPNALSGGQKQRVAICRAMMNKPKLLLMDEPLSALDPQMRHKLQNEILSLHKEFKTVSIMVSHDPSEIYKMTDRVLVLDKGLVIKDGEPKDVLLKTSGSQKFSFEGELLDILTVDVICVAVVSIGKQLVEVAISLDEAKDLKIGQKIRVSTKAFAPILR